LSSLAAGPIEAKNGDALTAVIRCGGAGSRLGGVDKPLQPLGGIPLIERVIARVRPQAGATIIVANRSRHLYARFGCPVIGDGEFAGRGPLAGIAAGLAASSTPWVLCVPGDAPLLPLDLVRRLREAQRSSAADAAVAHDGDREQPLCALLRRRLVAGLLEYLHSGADTPREWLRKCGAVKADFADCPRWAWSVNTAAEWHTAESRLAAVGS